MQDIMFVGLEVQEATISEALAQGDRGGEVRHWGTIANRADHVRKLADKLGGDGCPLQFCYEAGPCGLPGNAWQRGSNENTDGQFAPVLPERHRPGRSRPDRPERCRTHDE